MFLKKLSQKKKALTLVEILVVVLIISILIVALVPRVTSALDKAKETQIRTDFRTFATAAESVLRECAGFGGVPLMTSTERNLKTISEQFWNSSQNVAESTTGDTNEAVTQSLIKAVNRYLETSYQFGTNTLSPNFGRSAATDPWKKPYEIYFVSRNASQATDLNTDKIYFVSSGKTQNITYPDYSMLCEYRNGEVRTQTAGFGDAIPSEYITFAGEVNGKSYILLGTLFSRVATPDNNTLTGAAGLVPTFNMGTAINAQRLFIENTTEALTSVTAVNAK